MKRSRLVLSALVYLRLVCCPLEASQFFYEGFDFSEGDSMADHGWTVSGAPSFGTADEVVVTPGLEVSGKANSGNAVRVDRYYSGANNSIESYYVSTNWTTAITHADLDDSKTFYASCYLQVPALDDFTAGQYELTLNYPGTSGWGKYGGLRIKRNGDVLELYVIGSDGATLLSAVSAGTTYRILYKILLPAGSGQVWSYAVLDPGAEEPDLGSWTAQRVSGYQTRQNWSFGRVRFGYVTGWTTFYDGSVMIDEIRLGDSWGDVVGPDADPSPQGTVFVIR